MLLPPVFFMSLHSKPISLRRPNRMYCGWVWWWCGGVAAWWRGAACVRARACECEADVLQRGGVNGEGTRVGGPPPPPNARRRQHVFRCTPPSPPSPPPPNRMDHKAHTRLHCEYAIDPYDAHDGRHRACRQRGVDYVHEHKPRVNEPPQGYIGRRPYHHISGTTAHKRPGLRGGELGGLGGGGGRGGSAVVTAVGARLPCLTMIGTGSFSPAFFPSLSASMAANFCEYERWGGGSGVTFPPHHLPSPPPPTTHVASYFIGDAQP